MAVREVYAQLVEYCYEGVFDLADLAIRVEDDATKNGLQGGMERILQLWELEPDDPRLAKLRPAAEGKKGRKGRKTSPSEFTLGSGEQPSEEPDIWVKSDSGKILPIERNALKAIELMGVELKYDRFRREARIEGLDGYGPGIDKHAHSELYLAIQREHFFKVPAEDLAKMVVSAARRNSYDPITEYLDALVWDGFERLDEWLITYGGAEDNPYVREVGSKFLMAAVRRARQPGCKFDYMPVFEGEEGRGKSSVGWVLAGVDYFTDSIPLSSHEPRHTIESMRGKWIGELAELAQLKRADVETIKAWLSRTTDTGALKYDPESVSIPRRFVVFGTVNPDDMGYLQSKTGNRRFWPVKVEGFDLGNLARDRNQLWAEAAFREAKGESLELSSHVRPVAMEEQKAREMSDEWEEMIRHWADHERGEFLVSTIPRVIRCTIQKVAKAVLDINPDRLSRPEQLRIAAALRNSGFKRVHNRTGKFWERITYEL